MAIFKDIELEWAGKVYTIKAHRVMGAIARIEDVITLPELRAYAARGTAPLVKLSMAYGAVLRYAGAQVSDDEVYELAFTNHDPEKSVMMAVVNIMQMMIPPSALAKIDEMELPEADDLGNSLATAAPASSKKPTKSAAGRKTKVASA